MSGDAGEMASGVMRSDFPVIPRDAHSLNGCDVDLRALTTGLPCAVWEAVGTHPEGLHLRFISAYVEAMLGYPLAAWYSEGLSWLGVILEADRPRALQAMHQVMCSAGQGGVEFRVRRQDGQVRWLEMMLAPVVDATPAMRDDSGPASHPEIAGRPMPDRSGAAAGATGKPVAVGLRGVVMDITTRKEAEVSLEKRARELARLAHQLQKTNEELDQFAYITSHDLKAPLRGIANLSRWIEEDMGARMTAEAQQQMELLRGRVLRMENLIDGLLEYSRVGRVKTYVETVDVGKLVSGVVDLLSPPAGFRVEIEGSMPVLRGEKIRLQQVFMNLIGNAIKHHDHLSEGRVTIRCGEADGFYRFEVEDNGPGIAHRFHERIFVIFQTLLPRDQREGAGVGLSLVRKIVEEQGGTVEVESEEGRGALFHFTWPQDRAEPQAADRPPRMDVDGSTTTQHPAS